MPFLLKMASSKSTNDQKNMGGFELLAKARTLGSRMSILIARPTVLSLKSFSTRPSGVFQGLLPLYYHPLFDASSTSST